jgi:hypothetical protein
MYVFPDLLKVFFNSCFNMAPVKMFQQLIYKYMQDYCKILYPAYPVKGTFR